MSVNTPPNAALSQGALEAMQRTLKNHNIGTKIPTTMEDLMRDPDWLALFEQGYEFIENISPELLKAITGEQIRGSVTSAIDKDDLEAIERQNEELDWYSRAWYMQSDVERKTATAYEYGNPSQPKLKYPSVALFAKKRS